MNWYDGLALTWHVHGCGFKPWRTQIYPYFFGIFGFGLNMKS